ncbi:FtsB family cell division protein [Nocardioides ungokensis]|uniref:FtsB family cell division protein n=1 Tax=Nocardioides ungokensis TaxID=1643322 RepID=UPI001FE7ACCC|nr:septum formation initiator family protein [Nocardioides ungokensis]
MADNRRTPSRGAAAKGGSARGRTGPGRTTGSGRGGRPPLPPAGGASAQGGDRPRRPRLTGRAAILVLVVAVLAVSYASSMRAYLQQRAHIEDLKTQIAQRETNINDLEREKRRWHDPAFVQAQARQRFGYLMPGETSYVVLGEDGKPLETQSSLTDPATIAHTHPPHGGPPSGSR